MTDIFSAEITSVRKHFDTEFYLEEYPDVSYYTISPLVHFCRVGWKEGRNPNPFFDTTSYLLDYPDVTRARLNPYFHFLEYGRFEGRAIAPSFTPSVRSRLAFGHSIHDWLTILRPSFDVEFYLENLRSDLRERVNPLAHFAYRGWREGLSPNPVDDILDLTDRYAECAAMMVNPMVAKLLLAPVNTTDESYESSRTAIDANYDFSEVEGKSASSGPSGDEPSDLKNVATDQLDVDDDVALIKSSEVAEFEGEALALVRASMSCDYYLAKNPDVAAAGIDPAVHYFYTGWIEGRNPDRSFDTNYYLLANEDVRTAGINPYWHYLVAGRFEDRPTRRPGSYLRDVLDAASPPELKRLAYADRFRQMTHRDYGILISAVVGSKKLVLSISHDCYAEVIGGTQILIADEEQGFSREGYIYLHLSPLHPQPKLVDHTSDFPVVVTLSGSVLGWSTVSGLLEALGACLPQTGRTVLMIVHCLLGWNVSDVIRLARATKTKKNLFWLHDFSSACQGYNLLRNDIAFCGAPPSDSLACRICVYGEERSKHLEQISVLFNEVDFHVIAPSESALEIWSKAIYLPHLAAKVHPHWSFDDSRKTKIKKRTGRVKLGFLGYPSSTKRWHHFVDIATDNTVNPLYDFYQFSTPASERLPEANFVPTEVTPKDRFAAARLLDRSRIDAVLLLSPWPETFSFVMYEAAASGCKIFCLADSGNVAHFVEKHDLGLVFDDVEDLKRFLGSDGVPWLRQQRVTNTEGRIINSTGTSLTVLKRLRH